MRPEDSVSRQRVRTLVIYTSKAGVVGGSGDAIAGDAVAVDSVRRRRTKAGELTSPTADRGNDGSCKYISAFVMRCIAL